MADACQTILSRFEGKIAFVNAMMNISTECDCDGNASPPCMGDVGILSSLDPVALDQACHDLIYQSNDPGKKALIKRMEDIKAVHLLEAAEKLGLGTREYEIVT